MKEIKLTKGHIALVDDEDYEFINKWKWYPMKTKNTFYAYRSEYNPDNRLKPKTILMHRQIMNISTSSVIDHKDHDGLNNQKQNLRACTQQQNSFNSRASGKSKYLGVCYNGKHIRAKIQHNGKCIHIGYYKTEFEAAIAYNFKAIDLFGVFANINTIYETQ